MDKKQAQQLIENIFKGPFDRERYQHFLQNFLNKIEPGSRGGKHYTGNLIPEAFNQHVNQYWCLGKYIDPDGEELDLLVVEVKTFTKLERARTALRSFAVNRLKQFEKPASLIAFYAKDDGGADWRFSFVKIEHEAYKDDKGKVKLKQELTPAKRHSFLVGKHENSHTACKQLLPVLTMDYADPRIDEIEAAFSIEKVTDEFFDQYKALFQKLSEQLKKQHFFKCANEEEIDQAVSRFAKKLLGQIVFLYFLQKKGWLGAAQGKNWGEGSKRFMRERYEQIAQIGCSYYHDFLQYLFYEALACERKGQDDPGYYERFFCRIPFLNGGLFEADYDWQNETIDLPNSLFHNEEKTKAGDVGTGILDVFDRYNFTIKEDEPLDKEVAVDPEMLGKVFENMLEDTERKSKGAFYTPREIVHYMCQESLIHYLDNRLNSYATSYEELDSPQTSLFANTTSKGQLKLTAEHQDVKVPKEDIEILIRKGHLALENDTRVLSKGKETETYRFQLPESVRKQAKEIDAALADIKVCDPAIGSGAFPVGLLHEIVNARLALAPHSGNDKSAYDLKRHAIAESIYGVDIDASAIDIARLRLWLSLIVDEEDYGTIAALPNLDYKIVQGDSLIGFPENWQSPATDKIEELKKQFFAETDHSRKADLKKKIDNEIRKRMAGSKSTFGYSVDFDFRLMFSEVWHHKGGFDVVIGNPPYVLLQDKYRDEKKITFFKSTYEVCAYKVDLYHLFFEKSIKLINASGFSTLITPTNYQSNNYTKNLRLYLIKAGLEKIVNIEGSVFKASVNTSITEVNRYCQEKILFLRGLMGLNGDFEVKLIGNLSKSYFTVGDSLLIPPINDKASIVLSLLESRNFRRIGEISKVNFGMQLRDRKKFPNDVLEKPDKSQKNNYHKPCYTGRDIKAYNVKFNNMYCYFNREAQSGGCWNEDAQFSANKILVPQVGKFPEAGIDRNGFCVLNTAFMINVEAGISPEMILAFINSDVVAFYWINKFRDDRDTFPKIKGSYIELLPIASTNNVVEFKILVKYIEYLHLYDLEKVLQISFYRELLNSISTELYFPD
ncbi:MAG: Eco57I restriction-modification methylase domain-containing protein [Desulfuromonadales bacterium]|nr:Eco57I restriction-modification methylase domain-containing protein [Desulfuromonadales bacterium]